MKDKWDAKHGLGRRGTDYSAGNGATHGGSSLAQEQIKARIFELFGKTEHTADQRRMGIPTHFDQLQGLLKNLARDVGDSDALVIEQQIKKYIMDAVQRANIDIPPLGLVLPTSKLVWIFFRQGQNFYCYGQGFPGDLAATYSYWKVSGTELGDFRKEYSVYKAWAYYRDIATPAITAQNANYTVVGNFFGNGLQFE
ncbi:MULTISPECIES: hypothetical protein [unclassified Acidiphilium]|nr:MULTISPECIES: hypothetical protein [unclassified Acidiphilium]